MTPPFKKPKKPLTIGVFGGSFNPIHLGHALLAITVQQTQNVDQVVLVPVYKHAVKRDLMPFDDRVNMCRLAVQAFGNDVTVSTIEEQVGESNGPMLQALKAQYPPGTRLLWICGDDFFQWWDKPKGLETLAQVDGLIVQRRLHRRDNVFFKEPMDEAKIQSFAASQQLEVEFVYGELPHFSSTLVRRAPGHWRSFLTQSVVQYLDERPHLLQQLITNLNADAQQEEEEKKNDPPTKQQEAASSANPVAISIVMRGLEAVHALQIERGRAGLRLSMGTDEHVANLRQVQSLTDQLLREIAETPDIDPEEFMEASSLAQELKRIPVWLQWDRNILEKRADALAQMDGPTGWLARLALVEKFNPRIDVLIGATIRALTEILSASSGQIPELLYKWCEGKEALGRLRAFVCSGGAQVPQLVRSSLHLRERLHMTIQTKDRRIARVLSLEADLSRLLAAPGTLHRLLENVTRCEYRLMGTFAATTPIRLVHACLSDRPFDVVEFFDASTAAIDFLLSFSKAMTASACASV